MKTPGQSEKETRWLGHGNCMLSVFISETESKICNRNILRRWVSITQHDFHPPCGSCKSYPFLGRQKFLSPLASHKESVQHPLRGQCDLTKISCNPFWNSSAAPSFPSYLGFLTTFSLKYVPSFVT